MARDRLTFKATDLTRLLRWMEKAGIEASRCRFELHRDYVIIIPPSGPTASIDRETLDAGSDDDEWNGARPW